MASEIRAQNYYTATQPICVIEIFILCLWLLESDAWRELRPLHSTDGSPETWTWECTAENARRTQEASQYSSW
mgnify:CR=1 FL=1